MDFLPLFAAHVAAVFSPGGHRITISDLQVFSGQNGKSNICIVSKGILVWLRLVQIYFRAALLPFMQEGKKKKSLNLWFLTINVFTNPVSQLLMLLRLDSNHSG